MKAVVCERLGDPDVLVVRDVPAPPSPGAGDVKVKIEARGVSFVELLRVAGQYQDKSELPFIPGGEAAGVVMEIGAGSRRRWHLETACSPPPDGPKKR